MLLNQKIRATVLLLPKSFSRLFLIGPKVRASHANLRRIQRRKLLMLKLESSRYVVVLSVIYYTGKGVPTRPRCDLPPGSAQRQLEFGFG
jgi:hypothetical protein